MRSNIQQYDEALLDWILSAFSTIIPDKRLQVLFAPPDRAYAERVSGKYVVPNQLTLPRITVNRQNYEFDAKRFCSANIRMAGYTNSSRLKIKQAKFPVPVNIPYQINFWTEYESECQALITTFFSQLYAQIIYLKIYISPLYQDKWIPFILDSAVANETLVEPGADYREIRAVVPLRAETWLWDDPGTELDTVREVKIDTYVTIDDINTLVDATSVMPPINIGIGDGTAQDFAYTCQQLPVLAASALIFTTCAGLEIRGYDNGDGTISGSVVHGIINYATGELDVHFDVVVDALAAVYFEYQSTADTD